MTDAHEAFGLMMVILMMWWLVGTAYIAAALTTLARRLEIQPRLRLVAPPLAALVSVSLSAGALAGVRACGYTLPVMVKAGWSVNG